MSVLIRGMEMPKDCVVCPLGWNGCNHQHDFVYMGERPSDCPLVEVPPHGRLIDADALEEEMLNACMGVMSGCVTYKEPLTVLMTAQTIIPAEEGER